MRQSLSCFLEESDKAKPDLYILKDYCAEGTLHHPLVHGKHLGRHGARNNRHRHLAELEYVFESEAIKE